MDELPVVVIGAGPIGLAAAAQLKHRGLGLIVLEAGSDAGHAVAQWHHIRLFSTWSALIDPTAATLLEATGWRQPDPDQYPTGRDWAQQYLRPLAKVLGGDVHFDARVTGVARRGRDLVVDAGRSGQPLVVHVTSSDGTEIQIEARAVIDASGTWSTPNPLGGDGFPAMGERHAADRISYRVPDLSSVEVRDRYAGKRIGVAGSGHSALTALVTLTDLAEQHPGTEIVWLLRRGSAGSVFGGGDADQLPARGALGQRAKSAAAAGHIRTVTGFRTASISRNHTGSLVLESVDGRRLDPLDEVIVLTGFRPDLTWLSEVRLDLDPILQAPRALAPLIDPNVHSCGTVYPHGVRELDHPEKDVYIVGMKSYGRAPTFLAMTGYEQVRSVVAELAGDHEAATRVELTLPETGVCGGTGLFDDAPTADSSPSCCEPAEPELLELTSHTRV